MGSVCSGLPLPHAYIMLGLTHAIFPSLRTTSSRSEQSSNHLLRAGKTSLPSIAVARFCLSEKVRMGSFGVHGSVVVLEQC